MTDSPQNGFLGDFLTFKNGRSHPGLTEAGHYRVFGANGPIGMTTASNADATTVVVGRVGAYCGSVHLATGRTWVTDNAIAVTAVDVSETRFWYYALRFLNLHEWRAGSGQPLLTQSVLQSIPAPTAPAIDRARIASVLGAFDDLIETNRRLADQLDALRRTRVSDALAASSVTTSLNEVASFVNGRNFTNSANGTGRPVIRTPEVRSGPGGNTVWSAAVVADDGRVARVGDILFVWSGSLMVNRWLYTDGLVNQHVFKVIPAQVPDWYVFALIEAQLPWFLGLAKDKATTMGHIQRAHLDEPMTGLDSDTIARLSPVIEPIWSAALELRLEAQELSRQRDELLPLLMAGKVRVSEVDGVA